MTEKINVENLEEVVGGAKKDTLHDLSRFVERTVVNVVMYDSTACLTLRKTPNGAQIPNVGWKNGEKILVHGQYKEDGWLFAYDRKSGKFGYVNPKYVA